MVGEGVGCRGWGGRWWGGCGGIEKAAVMGGDKEDVKEKVGPWTKEEDEKLRGLVKGQTSVSAIKWR